MSDRYEAKTDAELEQIAARLLSLFPKRRLGLAVDIEGILEDLGLELLPRRGVRKYVEGYLARDPRWIVVDESIFSYLPRARFTIAEEVCHLVLEYKLWTGGQIPEGADCHELSEEQHFFIEKDATGLASALLMPTAEFSATFNARLRGLEAAGGPAVRVLRETVKQTADVFLVSPKAAGFRAKKLKLITRAMLKELL